jgi:hypothetical protein
MQTCKKQQISSDPNCSLAEVIISVTFVLVNLYIIKNNLSTDNQNDAEYTIF